MRPHRTGGQRALIGVNILLVIAALLVAAVLAYGYRRVNQISRVELDAVLTPAPGEVEEAAAGDDVGDGREGQGPENYLIVGTDSGERLDPDDAAAQDRPPGTRSDTIMVLRIDSDSTRAALLSLPRDLLVPIPGVSGRQRINEAVNIGGPSLLVRTIQSAFGIPVHHYVELDFRGFYDVVDAIGGVPIYFPEPVRDRSSGLDIPEPGCVTLDPQTALNYVRSRFYDVYRNGRWQRDATADLGRITRQQDFIRRAVRRAIDRGARNPAVLHELLNATLDNLTVDDRLTTGDLLDLALRFRDFNPENLDMYSVPVSDDVVNGAAVLRLREAEARPILDVFRGVQNGILTPASVMVTVRNGTGRPGLGAEVAAALRAAGFTVPDDAIDDADRFDYTRSTVLVPPGLLDAAELLARALHAGAEVVETDAPAVTGIELVVGSDFSGASAPEPLEPTTTTSGQGQEPVTTTSTVVGEIPVNPPDIAC